MRLPAYAAAATLLLALCACGESPREPDPGWPVGSADAVATDGLVWADGSEVHLADGDVLDVGRPLGGYVVSPAGVWFLDAGKEAGRPELRLATADGELHDTGAHPMPASLTVSADGSWLAFLDRPREDGPAELVVVDVAEGTEVVRSREGLVPDDADGEELDEVDWTDLYEELPVDVHGVLDDTVYVRGLEGTTAFSLRDGDAVRVPGPRPDDLPEWFRTLEPEPPYWNPARTWSIPEPEVGTRPLLRPATGVAVRTRVTAPAGGPPAVPGGPDLESWVLTGWLDDATAVGLTRTTDPTDPTEPATVLLTCTVPSGECQVVPGTEQGVALPLDRPSGLPPAGG